MSVLITPRMTTQPHLPEFKLSLTKGENVLPESSVMVKKKRKGIAVNQKKYIKRKRDKEL
jgi:hypothetical protein